MLKRIVCSAISAIVLGSIPAVGAPAESPDPAYYVKKDTWQETMQASREALVVHLAKPNEPKLPAKPLERTTRLLVYRLTNWLSFTPLINRERVFWGSLSSLE